MEREPPEFQPYKVKGAPPNSFALMLKIHHCAIDGISGAEIITAIHSLSDEIAPPVVDTWRGESAPSTWKVWSRAYFHNLRCPVKFVETISKLVPAVVNARQLSANSSADGPKTLSAKTRFNARISGNRVTDALIMDLAEVKSMRKALDNVTINDVVVAK
tara:strand:+ start:2512 stop:2991 length:480 start_codon:yes stop_codon:yes gene_type:complete